MRVMIYESREAEKNRRTNIITAVINGEIKSSLNSGHSTAVLILFLYNGIICRHSTVKKRGYPKNAQLFNESAYVAV